MKTFTLIMGIFLLSPEVRGQEMNVGFPIIGLSAYKDSGTIFEVFIPKGFKVELYRKGFIKHRYTSGDDQSISFLGESESRMAFEQSMLFFSANSELKKVPVAYDLIYVHAKLPDSTYIGVLFKAVSHSISLYNSKNEVMASMVDVVKIKSREEEKKVIQKLVDEVRFLGTELARLGRPDDKIQSGSLAGKSLFYAMQTATAADVEKFLTFIHDEQEQYEGNNHQFGSIMSKWIYLGSPTELK